jgi:rhodanese-related sulfurtransferase
MLASAEGQSPLLLDVRENWEFAICQIDGSLNVPMSQLPATLTSLDPAATTVVICHSGLRSGQVAEFLERNGFQDVINLEGGIDAWAREIDPSMATY